MKQNSCIVGKLKQYSRIESNAIRALRKGVSLNYQEDLSQFKLFMKAKNPLNRYT